MLLAELPALAQSLEAIMLVCFGLSWPIDIVNTLRVRHVEGKSFTFMFVIFVGYVLGVAGKFFRVAGSGQWPEGVTWMYAVNALLVAADMALFLHYRAKTAAAKPNPTLPPTD